MRNFAFTAVALMITSPANAQAQPRPSPETVRGVAECRKLTADAARLACYDMAAAKLEAAEASGEIVVVARDQVRDVRRQAFGFAMPSLSFFDRPGEEAQELTLKVLSASRGGDGKWVVLLEGGQTWRQIDTADLNRHPKAGGNVTIRRAALGSYKLSAGGASAIRVKREE